MTLEENKEPNMELSLEDGEAALQLREILDKKAKEKMKLQSNSNLLLLKKSKFYYSSDKSLREHIATYKGYAILLKQDMKKDIDEKTAEMHPSLVTLEDLRKMKKVNGNIIRKINPDTLHEYEKMALVQGVMVEIDKGL